jgi:hypothetical protein
MHPDRLPWREALAEGIGAGIVIVATVFILFYWLVP